MKIKISKPLKSAPWRVNCDHCARDGDFGLLASMFQPWAYCKNQATAMRIARWHIQLHREQTCGTCGNIPALPTLKPLDHPGLFKLGEEIYFLPGDGSMPQKVSTRV